MTSKQTTVVKRRSSQGGFSLIEMIFALTITLVIVGLTFALLARSLNIKGRADKEADSLADANQALSWMSQEIMNSGFGLMSNGLVPADCLENKIRVRANLNTLLKQTTSNTVTDQDEDIEYSLVPNPGSGSALVRSDVGKGTSTVIATQLDDVDADNDGDGDGLTFDYLDSANVAVDPVNAVRVRISIRIILPQLGTSGSAGYQPQRTKVLNSNIVLRNARRMSY